jgi:hypothetical protein
MTSRAAFQTYSRRLSECDKQVRIATVGQAYFCNHPLYPRQIRALGPDSPIVTRTSPCGAEIRKSVATAELMRSNCFQLATCFNRSNSRFKRNARIVLPPCSVCRTSLGGSKLKKCLRTTCCRRRSACQEFDPALSSRFDDWCLDQPHFARSQVSWIQS